MSAQAPLGPRPTRADRPRAAALRVLRALTESSGPATIAGLTDSLGGHPNTVRVQLDHLVEAGFAEVAPLPPQGRGRPSQAYLATLDGEQAAGQDDGRLDQTALIEAIAEHLAGDPDPHAAAVAVGRNWGRHVPATAAGDVCELLARQGFAPERVETGGLRLRTCPLLEVARRHPDVVCAMHQGLIDVTSAEPATLHPFAEPGACLVAVGTAQA